MIHHLVLQGDHPVRELALMTARALKRVPPTDARFESLGMRSGKPGRVVRAFRRLRPSPVVVRIVEDRELGALWVSVQAPEAPVLQDVARVLLEDLPVVSRDTILMNRDRFTEMPELVLLLALAIRRDPRPNELAAIAGALSSECLDLRATAAAAVGVVATPDLEDALRDALSKETNESARKIMASALRDFRRDEAGELSLRWVTDPEAAFHVDY